MFYSESILSKKGSLIHITLGPLATLWMAAHMEKKLSKSLILSTDIPASVDSLLRSAQEQSALSGGALPPMALRLKGQLLLGIVRIFLRKTRYLLEDCAEAIAHFSVKPLAVTEKKKGSAALNAVAGKAITIEEEPITTQELLSDLAEMWRAPMANPLDLDVELFRSTTDTALRTPIRSPQKRMLDPFDLFSVFPIDDNNESQEKMPMETLFPPTPLPQNPKLSLDRTLFGEPLIEPMLENVEFVRRSFPSIEVDTQVESMQEFLDEAMIEGKDAFSPLPPIISPLQPSVLSAGIPTGEITPTQRSSFAELRESADIMPSPIETTKIFGSPENFAEVAKILAFDSEPQKATRKRHKGVKSDTITVGDRKAFISFYMDPITELTSATIQMQLGSGGQDTLEKWDEFFQLNKIGTSSLFSPPLNIDVVLLPKLAISNHYREPADSQSRAEPVLKDLVIIGPTAEKHLSTTTLDGEDLETGALKEIHTYNDTMQLDEALVQDEEFVTEAMGKPSPGYQSDENSWPTDGDAEIIDFLKEKTTFSFSSVLKNKYNIPTKREVALGFYGLLRLACQRQIRLLQEIPYEDILITNFE